MLVVGAVASGALEEAGTGAELGVGEFLGEAATSFFFIRFLAGAATGRRSAWTGLGTNRGAESTPDSERTEMVCGW